MVLWVAAALAAERPDEVRQWSAASTWARTGVVVTAVGLAGDAIAGPWSVVNWITDDAVAPRVQDAFSLTSSTVLALGITSIGIGGNLACGVVRRSGVRCPVWAGWAAITIEALALGLLWADPILVARGRDPLPAAFLRGYVTIAGLPFAAVQLDLARRRAREAGVDDRPLLGFGVSSDPAGLWVAGRF